MFHGLMPLIKHAAVNPYLREIVPDKIQRNEII